MKCYVIIFEESGQADVRESYDWGRRTWGKHKARQWIPQLRTAVSEHLAIVRKAFRLRLKMMISPKKLGPGNAKRDHEKTS